MSFESSSMLHISLLCHKAQSPNWSFYNVHIPDILTQNAIHKQHYMQLLDLAEENIWNYVCSTLKDRQIMENKTNIILLTIQSADGMVTYFQLPAIAFILKQLALHFSFTWFF